MEKIFLIVLIAFLGSCTKKQNSTSTTEIITTIAGNGYETGISPSILGGYSGDGGIATAAELNNPAGVAVDSSENVYIADYNNSRIRKVSNLGIITTFAEISYPSSVAIDDSGNVYVANGTVVKINPIGIKTTFAGNGLYTYSGDGGAAIAAGIDASGVAIDGSGNVYIADFNNRRVRKVNRDGIITTIAGNGTTGFSGDGGAATSAELNSPSSIALDASGNIYIADGVSNRVRKVNTLGIITTIAGNGFGAGTGNGGYSGDGGVATSAELHDVFGVAVDGSSNVFIVDYANNRIRKVDASGIISTIVGNGIAGFSGDGGVATSAEINAPDGIALDRSGNIYIVDCNNQRIRKVSK